MTERVIIGLSGRAGAGKDTAAAMLREMLPSLEVRVVSFSDPLKRAVQAIFGFSDEQLYGERKEEEDEYWGLSPRVTMQRFGTEAMRQVFFDDIWIRALERRVQQMPPKAVVVVTDVRFPNEAKWIKRCGGKVWRLRRYGIRAVAAHSSETALDSWEFDATVVNERSLEDLRHYLGACLYYSFERVRPHMRLKPVVESSPVKRKRDGDE